MSQRELVPVSSGHPEQVTGPLQGNIETRKMNNKAHTQ